jgi:hypothetical protein
MRVADVWPEAVSERRQGLFEDLPVGGVAAAAVTRQQQRTPAGYVAPTSGHCRSKICWCRG